MPTSLLVTGASGHLGRMTLQHLRRLGAADPIATSRTSSGTQRHADFDDPGSLPAAFAGARRMLLISTALSNAGPRRVGQHRNAIDAALKAGVHTIVYTSLLGAREDDHAHTEAMLRDSGMHHVVLRNAYYMDPLRETLAAAAACGELVSAATDGRAAYVSRDDCARAATHALLAPPARQVLDIAGPQALDGADLAAIGSIVFNKPIRFRSVAQASRVDLLTQSGTPPQLARMIAHMETSLDDGAMDSASTDYATLTGRGAHSLEDFLAGRT